MDVKLVKPFLTAVMHVLKTMAKIDAVPGKPFFKKDNLAIGDVSAIIGITGASRGSMALVFTEPCIKAIASSLFGTDSTLLNHEVRDAVGELTNMICGDARRRLSETGFTLQAGIPTVVGGKGHSIEHIADGPRVAIPFQTHAGTFMLEVAFQR